MCNFRCTQIKSLLDIIIKNIYNKTSETVLAVAVDCVRVRYIIRSFKDCRPYYNCITYEKLASDCRLVLFSYLSLIVLYFHFRIKSFQTIILFLYIILQNSTFKSIPLSYPTNLPPTGIKSLKSLSALIKSPNMSIKNTAMKL